MEKLTKEIKNSESGKYLINFYADWCDPCKKINGILEEINNEGFKIYTVNIDDEPDLSSSFYVKGVPAFVMMSDGIPQEKYIGPRTKDELIRMFD